MERLRTIQNPGVKQDGSVISESEDCENLEEDDDDCEEWAADGQCERTAGFMLTDCAKSCKVCHLDKATLKAKIKGLEEAEKARKKLERQEKRLGNKLKRDA